MRRIVVLIMLLTVPGAMGIRAESTLGDEHSPTELKDSIVVTANRFGLSPEKSVWPTAIIKTEQMADQSSLETALEGRAGLDIRGYNGVGSVSTLSSWGVFNRHMLLLYDGRAVKDYSLGGFNLSDYSPEEFERVEVLKGPQSAFYGSDAVGGVVNLITKSALVDRVEIVSKYGTQNFQQYHLDLSRRLGRFGLGGFAEFNKADNNRDNAGAERIVAGLRGEYLSADGRHHLSFSGRYFNDSLGVPGPVPDGNFIPVYGGPEASSLTDHQKDENYSVDLKYHIHGEAFDEAQLDAFWEQKNLDYKSLYNYSLSYLIDGSLAADSVDVFSETVYTKRSSGLSGRILKRLSSVTLAGGIDWLSGSVKAAATDDNFGVNISGPYAPWVYDYTTYNFWSKTQSQFDLWGNSSWKTFANLQLDGSGRVQFVKDRRAQASYNLGLVYSPLTTLRVKLGYAYAFRLPGIAEQFAEDAYTAGNSDLEPETARSVIGTISYQSENQRVAAEVTGFRQAVESLIQYRVDSKTWLSVPVNVERFRSIGLDYGLNWNVARNTSLAWSGVWQKAEQSTADGAGFVDAYYVPDLKWRGEVEQAFKRFHVNVNVTYTSDRSITMYGGAEKVIGKVYEWGMAVGADVTKNVSMSLIGYDLTDERRPDQFGFTTSDGDYPSPGGRIVFVTKFRL